MNPKRHRPPGPSSRDLGLVNADAGKGDAPRNLSAKFRENFDGIDFGPRPEKGSSRTLAGRWKKTYK